MPVSNTELSLGPAASSRAISDRHSEDPEESGLYIGGDRMVECEGV
jgi:hypothetical protein